MAEEKRMTLAEYAAKLNKEYKNNNLLVKSGIVPAYTRLSSGLTGLDYPLYGGLAEGRMHVFSGLEGSGKTTAALAFLAAYQKEHPDKTCLYVDVERSLDIKFQVMMNHIDQDKLFWMIPDNMSAEQILEAVLEAEDSEDIGLIVIDSVPALQSGTDMENEFTKDMGMRSSIARSMQKFLKAICDKLHQRNNLLILINQVRIAGKTYTGANIYSEPGGSYISFAASTRLRFGSRVFLKDGEELKGSDGEGATGFRLKFKTIKCKVNSVDRGGGFASFTYLTGADYLNDMLEVALKFEFIKRLNNVTYALVDLDSGELFVDPETGKELKDKKAALIEYLATHEEFRDNYFKILKRHISASNDVVLLDKETQRQIDTEEHAITNGGLIPDLDQKEYDF